MSIVEECQTHLANVLATGAGLDVQLLNRMTDQLRLDKSYFFTENDEPSNDVILALLPSAIGILKTSSASAEDLVPVIELIEALLAPRSFDEVLGFISIDDLVSGLESGISPLQTICIKQISKAQPPDLIANTPLIDQLLQIFANPSSTTTQVVQDALVKLANKGQLVIKRIFSESTSSVLYQMHESNNAILQARLMSLLENILALNWEVPTKLIQSPLEVFDPESSDWDILHTLSTVQFYRTIVENPYPKTLINDIKEQIEAIVKLFAKRNEYGDVRMFLLTEIFLLFRNLSRKEYDFFADLDGKYKLVEGVLADSNVDERISLLTFVNPKYLLQYPSAIESVRFKSADIPILRNLCTYEPTFKKLDPDQAKLMTLSYQDLLLLLLVIVKTPFGLTKLLSEWPQVMTSVVSKENIRVPEVFNLRRELLEILMHKPASTLGVWYGGVKVAYGEVVFGPGYGQDAQVTLADKSM